MNRWLFGIFATFSLASSSESGETKGPETPTAAEERQVLKLEREWTAAEIKGDAATLRHILDDRFVATFGAAKPLDREGFIKEVIGSDTDKIVSQDLSDETVRVDGDTAVVVETDTVRGTDNGEPYT